jgi:hypothetical protein
MKASLAREGTVPARGGGGAGRVEEGKSKDSKF